jgi:hypothetical protein
MDNGKSRYFTFLIYPESADSDWISKVEQLGQPVAISPLHDKDLSENSDVTGDKYKKAHYHCIYIANNPVTAGSVRNKLKRVLNPEAVTLVQPIISTVSDVYLYLTHESKTAIEKGKHKYDKKDIIHLNNFDVERYITLDAEALAEARQIVVKLVRQNKFQNLVELYDYLEVEGIEAYGLPSGDKLDGIIQSRAPILNKLFDSHYQIAKRQQQSERGLNEYEQRLFELEKLVGKRKLADVMRDDLNQDLPKELF